MLPEHWMCDGRKSVWPKVKNFARAIEKAVRCE